MKEKIEDVSLLLDDCINKAWTFNPYRPVDMVPGDEQFYTPYRWNEGGGYEPFPVAHWKDKPGNYNTTEAYYDTLAGVDGALARLRGFGKSLIKDKK